MLYRGRGQEIWCQTCVRFRPISELSANRCHLLVFASYQYELPNSDLISWQRNGFLGVMIVEQPPCFAIWLLSCRLNPALSWADSAVWVARIARQGSVFGFHLFRSFARSGKPPRRTAELPSETLGAKHSGQC